MAKCNKSELMALISSMLCNFVKDKMIDDKELDLIIKCIKRNTKNSTESIEDVLDKITDAMIENLFKD